MAQVASESAEVHKMSGVLNLIGLIVVLLAVLADPLGLGQHPGLGWKQGLGVVVGLVLIEVSWFWARKRASAR